MSDATTTLQQLKDLMLRFVEARDWMQFHAPKNLAAAILVEAGELMEPFTWLDPAASAQLLRDDPAKRRYVQQELADVMLLLCEFANVTGLDLSTAVREKLSELDTRYPADKHRGRAEKYNEIE